MFLSEVPLRSLDPVCVHQDLKPKKRSRSRGIRQVCPTRTTKTGPAASAGRIERGHVDMDAVALILQGDARKGGDVKGVGGEEGVSRTPSSEMMEEGEMWEAWWGETEGEQERSLAPYTGEVRLHF